ERQRLLFDLAAARQRIGGRRLDHARASVGELVARRRAQLGGAGHDLLIDHLAVVPGLLAPHLAGVPVVAPGAMLDAIDIDALHQPDAAVVIANLGAVADDVAVAVAPLGLAPPGVD